ncbi:cardiolipin synthase [Planococcus shenhongbingii]|uniref:Cardiolipin synthase n=1 Tax=Planococcus shenhongbingii TaxID=3058398 RepID=A0ABT8NGS8_9BACL|nr:cardiolipin synthase [Planococcus sp. N017]MDN7246919.1 cardiolipin synthase [Planococcus sp. N017]
MSNILFLTNTVLAVSILFIERKRATSKWAWFMVLFFLPYLGLLLYLLFGKPHRKNKGKHSTAYSNPKILNLSDQQLTAIDEGSFSYPSEVAEEWQHLIRMNLKSGVAPFTQNNQLEIYTDGKRKFEALFKDIEAANSHIHLEYYMVKNDAIGKKLIELLTEKARQGIEVLFLYDDIGSNSLPKNFFDAFLAAGGRAAASLRSRLPFGNPRVNYRNHRKIAILDGKVGFIGGFNVGDEYLGRDEKFGYWRDTHLRFEGEAVHSLQHRFLSDWNQTSENLPVKYEESYFPAVEVSEGAGMQVVASGPDESLDQIKNGYLRMIAQARKSIYIQTPYLIPDLAILDALSTAALSGIDVRVMIPSKADHIFVFSASLSYAKDLVNTGVKVYTYGNGFLHAKTIVVDGKVFSIGSANMDVRSFSLNYEANAFGYDVKTAEEMILLYFNDLKLSEELTKEYFQELSLINRFRLQIAQLVAPIL